MLVILYGPISHMGYACRQYFYEKGFEQVEKYNYIGTGTAAPLTPAYGTRNYVTKKAFERNTDPLFRYQVDNIMVGCNRSHIARAVNDEVNSLMSLSTGDIDFLVRMKNIYGSGVRMIYTYIDEHSLRKIVEGDQRTAAEAEKRLAIGQQVRQGYLKHPELFDDVIIYGGEDSSFDIQRLYTQIDALLARYFPEEEKPVEYADVVIPYVPEDEWYYQFVRDVVEEDGYTVFDNRQLPEDPDKRAAMMEAAIQNARMVAPIITAAFRAAEGVGYAFVVDAIRKYEKKAVALSIDETIAADFDAWYYDPEEALEEEKPLWLAAKTVGKLLKEEDELLEYSSKAESYLRSGMYEEALHYQEKHRMLCNEGYESLIPHSGMKLASIFLIMGMNREALQELRMLFDWINPTVSLPEQWMDLFVVCCRRLQMDEEALYAQLAQDNVHTTEERHRKMMGALRTAYPLALKRARENNYALDQSLVKRDFAAAAVPDTNKAEIAKLGEQALELFEKLVQAVPCLSRQDLKDGYQRIIDYCREMGLTGAVPKECQERISTLNGLKSVKKENATPESTALKVYLGKAYPESGYYDVFISYKSVNEQMARHVYNYLTGIGKMVFFAPETLHLLGNSDYTTEIMKAITHSQNMLLVSDVPGHLNSDWVRKEWEAFMKIYLAEKGTRNLLVLLSDEVKNVTDGLPAELRDCQVLHMKELKTLLTNYLRIGGINTNS
ncbi:MAG: toll/interleukin-1 receptor domain-containing protein [Clostridia bacterium]|nr:toll/interleukin-1 receptor domain-containing protein [Clostridia bacterium]